jgi:Arc/MetJ-type ribon-helix-helix transcriptional regulator
MPPTRKISIRLTERHYEMLELLVEMGEFTSVSEAIRAAVKSLLEGYKDEIENFAKLGKYS